MSAKRRLASRLLDAITHSGPGYQQEDDLYFCPTVGEIESKTHGGFDACCARPDRHIDVPDIPAVHAISEYLSEKAKLPAHGQHKDLATEFRVPLTNEAGGYGEVVVRRLRLGADKWCVTDGANSQSKVWVDGQWTAITDLGLDAAHPYSLDEALTTAHQVAEYEGATYEAWVKATGPDSGEEAAR